MMYYKSFHKYYTILCRNTRSLLQLNTDQWAVHYWNFWLWTKVVDQRGKSASVSPARLVKMRTFHRLWLEGKVLVLPWRHSSHPRGWDSVAPLSSATSQRKTLSYPLLSCYLLPKLFLYFTIIHVLVSIDYFYIPVPRIH